MATGALLSPAARRLEGKVAVITGGACSIGESTARHGARVIIADIHDDLGKFVCEDLGPETASFVHCDVSSESDIKNAIATAVDKHGKVDIGNLITEAVSFGSSATQVLYKKKSLQISPKLFHR